MLALAARRMGYRIHTFSPDVDSPTGQVADRAIEAAYTDLDAVRHFVRSVEVVTFEFENVPADVARVAEEEGVPVRPAGSVLHTAQNRAREKSFLAHNGLPVTPFWRVDGVDGLLHALERIGCPAILKSASFGYDGKGQVRIDRPESAVAAWAALGQQNAILEKFVEFTQELSVVAARGVDGSFVHYGAIENIHRHHILDVSLAPARVSPAVLDGAVALTRTVLEKLNVVGVLCVEFFLTEEGELLINEIAPRPHNSGHLTVDAAMTCQFEQQLRAVCGLPLGSTELLRPAVMVNLLGDLWFQHGIKQEPNWAAACALPNVKLHLYGKHEARPGRKMGHMTALALSVEEALSLAMDARAALTDLSLGGCTREGRGRG